MNKTTLMQKLKPLLESQGLAVFYKEDDVDQLIIPLAKEDGTALNCELNTIEDPHDLYPQTEFIQLFITLNIEVTAIQEDAVKAAIGYVNLALPIGSFNYHESGVIFYKYSIIVDKNYPQDSVTEVLNSIDISNHLFQSYEASFIEILQS